MLFFIDKTMELDELPPHFFTTYEKGEVQPFFLNDKDNFITQPDPETFKALAIIARVKIIEVLEGFGFRVDRTVFSSHKFHSKEDCEESYVSFINAPRGMKKFTLGISLLLRIIYSCQGFDFADIYHMVFASSGCIEGFLAGYLLELYLSFRPSFGSRRPLYTLANGCHPISIIRVFLSHPFPQAITDKVIVAISKIREDWKRFFETKEELEKFIYAIELKMILG